MCQCMTFILISNFSEDGLFIYFLYFIFLPQTAGWSRDCVLHIQHIPGTLTFHLQGCTLGWGLTRRQRGETARSGTGGGWGEGEDGEDGEDVEGGCGSRREETEQETLMGKLGESGRKMRRDES